MLLYSGIMCRVAIWECLKVMSGVRLFCVFVLTEGGINLPAASVSSSPLVASSIVVSGYCCVARPLVIDWNW